MKKILIIILIIIFLTTTVNAWWDADWQNKRKITIPANQILSPLTDYPVFIDLSDLNNTTFFSNIESDGSDLVITNEAEDTQLSLELVTISTGSETGELYFKAPTLSSTTDNIFYLYYNNNTATETNDTTTWNSNYTFIHHLEENPGSAAPQMIDSTSNNVDGTSEGTMVAGDSVLGTIDSGNALDFDGTDDAIALGSQNITSEYTITAWTNLDAGAGNRRDIITQWGADLGYILTWDSANSRLQLICADTSDVLWTPGTFGDYEGTWHHIAVANDGNARIFVDGDLKTYDTTCLTGGTSATTAIAKQANGGNVYKGKIDEVRVMNTDVNADWIKTEYQNLKNPFTFNTIASEEDYTPVIADFNYTINKTTNQINFLNQSSCDGCTITDYNWIINNNLETTNENLNYTTTQLTDLNACLRIDSTLTITSTTCEIFNSGDWTPPTNTASHTRFGETDEAIITITCTDNNAGCKNTWWKLDTNTTWNKIANTGSIDFNIIAVGSHTITYFSQDNASNYQPLIEDNNSTPKTYNYVLSGHLQIMIKEEKTNTNLNDFTVNFDGNTWLLNYGDKIDLNGRSGTKTIIITKPGYSTYSETFTINPMENKIIDQNLTLYKLILNFTQSTNVTILTDNNVINYSTSIININQSHLPVGKVKVYFNDGNQLYEYYNNIDTYIEETLYVTPGNQCEISIKVRDLGTGNIADADIFQYVDYLDTNNWFYLQNRRLTDADGVATIKTRDTDKIKIRILKNGYDYVEKKTHATEYCGKELYWYVTLGTGTITVIDGISIFSLTPQRITQDTNISTFFLSNSLHNITFKTYENNILTDTTEARSRAHKYEYNATNNNTTYKIEIYVENTLTSTLQFNYEQRIYTINNYENITTDWTTLTTKQKQALYMLLLFLLIGIAGLIEITLGKGAMTFHLGSIFISLLIPMAYPIAIIGIIYFVVGNYLNG